jgi:hypothetical protein
MSLSLRRVSNMTSNMLVEVLRLTLFREIERFMLMRIVIAAISLVSCTMPPSDRRTLIEMTNPATNPKASSMMHNLKDPVQMAVETQKPNASSLEDLADKMSSLLMKKNRQDEEIREE